VPGVLNGTGASAALVGAMLPVSNTPGSVAVWAIESEFNQFTDWPTLTDTGLGEYTPFLMVTVSRLGGFTHSGFVGVGVHGPVGLVGLFELPHPLAMSATITAMSVHRVVHRAAMMDRLRIGVFNGVRSWGQNGPTLELSGVGVLASVSPSIPSAYARTV
jgi:hypothetical protein